MQPGATRPPTSPQALLMANHPMRHTLEPLWPEGTCIVQSSIGPFQAAKAFWKIYRTKKRR